MYNQSSSFSGKYLQPVLFLNSVNRQNSLVLLGLHGHWDLWRKFRLYGQYVANTASLKPGTAGWWGNQTGWQAGLKYFNVLNVDNLDVQLEVNSVRPYMYMDADSLNNWTHYRHPLAHPLGANFKELIGVVRFRPLPQLSLSARALFYAGLFALVAIIHLNLGLLWPDPPKDRLGNYDYGNQDCAFVEELKKLGPGVELPPAGYMVCHEPNLLRIDV